MTGNAPSPSASLFPGSRKMIPLHAKLAQRNDFCAWPGEWMQNQITIALRFCVTTRDND